MKIGVYVGSFNPVHKAHIKLVKHLLNNNYLDKIIIIATGNYWDKADLVDIENRIEMLRFYQTDKIIINDDLNSLKYTFEILNELNKRYENDELFLIIGSDNIEKFHLWKKVDLILKNKVLVLPRGNMDFLKIIENNKEKKQFFIITDFEGEDISSTIIRTQIKENKKTDLIDDFIYEYILENNLYSS